MVRPKVGDFVKLDIGDNSPDYVKACNGKIGKIISERGFFILEGFYRPYPDNGLPVLFLRSELKKLYKISKNKLTLKLYTNKIEKEEGDYIWVS